MTAPCALIPWQRSKILRAKTIIWREYEDHVTILLHNFEATILLYHWLSFYMNWAFDLSGTVSNEPSHNFCYSDTGFTLTLLRQLRLKCDSVPNIVTVDGER